MTDDIFARLRLYADLTDAVYNPWVYREAADEIERLRAEIADMGAVHKALELALCWLAAHEPGDSRAVSDEFVAMTAILSNCANDHCVPIIERALAAYAAQEKTDD
jgi:hypothetical protein